VNFGPTAISAPSFGEFGILAKKLMRRSGSLHPFTAAPEGRGTRSVAYL
jgi:hypothetical protein